MAYWDARAVRGPSSRAEAAWPDAQQAGTAHPLGPIDVVYTWVDSADPAWRERFDRGVSRRAAQASLATAEERFLTRDELRYSLRSLHRYAQFVRRIFIVTDGQVPVWLNTGHPQIEVVDHRSIFPEPHVLPTFNPRAIEACLHRIPGLSRYFIYFNDDVLLGRPVRPDAFFANGGAVVVRRQRSSRIEVARESMDTRMWASQNSLELVRRLTGKTPLLHTLAHTPCSLDRRLLEDVEEEFPADFAQIRASTFRSRTDIKPITLALMYALATERGRLHDPDKQEFIHVTLGARKMGQRLLQIRRVNPTFYCLNSTPTHREVSLRRQSRIVGTFLADLLPESSPYERS